MNAYKVFTTLELTEKMPKFPFDFPTGSLIGLIPPLWHFAMNPYVDEVLEGKPVPKNHRKAVFYIKEGMNYLLMLGLLYNTYSTYQFRSNPS